MDDYDLVEELRPNLASDEKLIWTGRPKTGIQFRRTDAFLIPFSLLWCGFAIFVGVSGFRSTAPLFFNLFHFVFVLIGLYVTIGRFFLDAKKRANTVYGITEDRIIIKSGIFSKEIKSLNIKSISDITFTERADKTGTITLGPVNFRYSMMDGMEWPGIIQPPRLAFIDEVKNVYDKIVFLQRQKY